MGLGLGNILWWIPGDGAALLGGETFDFDVEFSQSLCAGTEITNTMAVDVEFTRAIENCVETSGTYDEDPEFGVDIDKPTDR